jgi:ligand-binding sensor domain-containing protein
MRWHPHVRYGRAMTTPAPALGSGEVLNPIVGAAAVVDLAIGRTALGVERGGNVWFAGPSDLVRLAAGTLTSFRFADGCELSGVAAGPPGVVYVATSTGLVRFAGGVFTRLPLGRLEPAPGHLATSPNGDAVFTVVDGTVTRIAIYDGTALRLLSPGADFPPDLAITRIGFDAAGDLVIGAAGAVALQRDGTWTVIRGLDPSSNFASSIDAIASAAGVVWLASPAGVYEYRGGTFALHRTARPVVCLCVDGDDVWLGMRAGGLGRLRAGELSVFQPGGTQLPHADVTDLVRGEDGRIWVLAGGAIAFIREGEIGRIGE